ncbi:hypothetical protein H4R20_000580 [Coemansia guatemalensis]|uniref:DUF2039 domain-containing protein n=1 Tax=Coemansia guatemalensis TaxID=2761395 RepID=A0A9W8LU01_9FUNG|nr:hypothetical protein H4R20_000580 [Coemansia guatemalensis]
MPEKVSTRGSGAKKGAPKYQNKFAYTHNKGSKKTQAILALPVDGLCRRCTDQIQWRKQYRKYKPLTAPRKCVGCELKKVRKAYHVLCDDCAGERGVCAKCAEKAEIIDESPKTSQEAANEQQAVEQRLAGMRERQRRTYLRRLERGEITAADILDGSDDSDNDSSGSDSSDSEADRSSGDKPQ